MRLIGELTLRFDVKAILDESKLSTAIIYSVVVNVGSLLASDYRGGEGCGRLD
jgi:hypothetical protein